MNFILGTFIILGAWAAHIAGLFSNEALVFFMVVAYLLWATDKEIHALYKVIGFILVLVNLYIWLIMPR